MSTGCFDTSKNGELVAVSVTKDLNYSPEGLEEGYMKGLNYISSVMKLYDKLLSQADEKTKRIVEQKGYVMDVWAIAVKEEYLRKNIINPMLPLNFALGRQAGYKYASAFCTNFKSAMVASRNKYTKVLEINARVFETDGLFPFKFVDPDHEITSFWLKDIDVLPAL
jgi:hypothetical protein